MGRPKGSKNKKKTPNGADSVPLPTEVTEAATAPTEPTPPALRQGVERARFEEKLPVPADPSEQIAAGAELAKLVDAREALKIERREAMADFKQRMSGIDERSNECAGIFKGIKHTNVLCVEKLYVETNTVDVVRLDTGEVVRSRAATAEDRQEDLAMQTREAADIANAGAPLTEAQAAALAPEHKTVGDITNPEGVLAGDADDLNVDEGDPLEGEDDLDFPEDDLDPVPAA